MSEEISAAAKVTYTIKELLQEIRDDVKGLDAKLDTKADRSEVIALATRVTVLERSIDLTTHTATTKREHRRWVLPIMVSVLLTCLSPLLWVVFNHLFG